MPAQNSDVKDILNKMADLLEIDGANPFRVRAYRNAARTVSNLPKNLTEMIEDNEDLTKLSGIGEDLAGKITEIVETGTLSQLKKLQEDTPPELHELMKLEGLGPKRVRVLNRELGIETLDQLKDAAESGKVETLEGFGKKTQQNVLEALNQAEGWGDRIKLVEAEERAEPLTKYLKKTKGIKEITIAGSFRRRKETVGDLDILVTCKKGARVMERFVAYEDVKKVISQGDTRSTIMLNSGLHVDLRVVPQVSYGSALHYFTGSKNHNIAVRKIANGKGFKINEYGVFKGDDRVAGKNEKDVYAKVGMAYVEPELRENQGEVAAAQQDALPDLVNLKDIRGDLHSHTEATDGHNSLEEMAEAAKKRGYEYLAVTEHSKKVAMAKGLDAKDLARQMEAIDHLNEKLKDIRLLKGIEVDILEDGGLDLPDDILKELDLRICSIHYNRNLSREKQTERIIRAMDNPYFNILAHPSGRLINEREPYAVDLQKVMQAAKDRRCFLELNAHPDRLDLSDHHCKMAKEMNLKVAISTDAHSVSNLNFMRFGIGQARRGWLEAADVLNTRTWKQLKKLLHRR
ncbi:MAG: DNA polymerase/3'-5' exonuclease PolX [Deltaproteobacteria bacterium]|nr:DNA polymerase/3'-5' exonuclease PolX [Deltaproteobacteria bacterium]